MVKDEEEVEVTTTLGLRDVDEEFVTTFAPETERPFPSSTRRRGGQGGSPTRRRRPMPHRVDSEEDVSRGQSRKEDQSLFQQRRGEAQFFAPGPVPRPHQVRGTAPGRFQDRVLVSEAADQNRNVDQRFSQGADGFQNQGFQFQDQGRPQAAFQDQGRPQVAFQDRDRFEEARPFQNQGQFRPPQQDRNRFEETRPFLDQGRPQQDTFEDTRPFQSQGQFRPPQQFQGQGQQQFLPPQRFQEEREQLFQTRPEAPAFQEADQYEETQPFPQDQDPQAFLAPQPDPEQFETQPPFFPEEEEEEEEFLAPQRPSPSVPSSQPSRVFSSPPLVREGEQVASPEVEAAIQTLSQGTPALPPPHPVCFEAGLVPDYQLCYAFHECVIEDGEWQMYSWRCPPGHVYDPINVECIRGRCASRRRLG